MKDIPPGSQPAAKGRLNIAGRPKSRIAHAKLCALSDLAESAPNGCFVEVGVYQGGSAWYLNAVAEKQHRELHLFDTFTGIPDKCELDRHAIGDYGDVDLADLQKQFPRASFHVGLFPATLPPVLDRIALAHIDCDQYDGHKACIDLLFPRLVSGGIIAFDDYPALAGARLAVSDAFTPDQLRLAGDVLTYVVKP